MKEYMLYFCRIYHIWFITKLKKPIRFSKTIRSFNGPAKLKQKWIYF